MQAEVLIALISGAAGVIGAVTAWVQSLRANRLKARVDIALEQIKSEASFALEALKIENERRRKAFELASQESAPIETALVQAWQEIQIIKEVIAKLLSPTRYDKDVAINDLRPAVLRLDNGYNQHGASMPETARSAWHRAKKCAALVEGMVSEQDNASSLSNTLAESLKSLRRELTDQQLAIVAAREDLRRGLMARLLELI